MAPFDIVKIISQSKTPIEKDDEFEAAYIPYIINKALSLYADTIFFANEMNIHPHLSKNKQFDYLCHCVRSRKRYTEWPKKLQKNEDLELIKRYYGYNIDKAKVALSLLDEKQIKIIKEAFMEGGLRK